jgi:hypothetical protein
MEILINDILEQLLTRFFTYRQQYILCAVCARWNALILKSPVNRQYIISGIDKSRVITNKYIYPYLYPSQYFYSMNREDMYVMMNFLDDLYNPQYRFIFISNDTRKLRNNILETCRLLLSARNTYINNMINDVCDRVDSTHILDQDYWAVIARGGIN